MLDKTFSGREFSVTKERKNYCGTSYLYIKYKVEKIINKTIYLIVTDIISFKQGLPTTRIYHMYKDCVTIASYAEDDFICRVKQYFPHYDHLQVIVGYV
jgi:hypothetical protein